MIAVVIVGIKAANVAVVVIVAVVVVFLTC